MRIRFGFVAMSMVLENASPSKTMTYTSFAKLEDIQAGIHKLERIAEQNLHNTLRLLKHCAAEHIGMYRFSSKLVPLATHEALEGWDPVIALQPAFQAIGDFAKAKGIRTSFHPDHFCVFSTPRPEVLAKSEQDLAFHVRMLEAMGLAEDVKCNIHMGGAYGDKAGSGERFIQQFNALPGRLKHRVTLENDDKTYTVRETLAAAEAVGVPMVLDLHHHAVNDGGDSFEALAEELWPRIERTWERERTRLGLNAEQLPPKIHASSPKSVSDPRGHADYVEPQPLLQFFHAVAGSTPGIDCMLEAKAKDKALFRLMEDWRGIERENPLVRVTDGAAIEVNHV
ncbi:UV DNA damage repair endonuclease UvsE [Paenibacillus protaetiae]|uniref:UV DNA damage repair endonuclease UvsE n=1 Tax=Paenibacillus protaetiae TaxID=2509456 RepID=A0A4P6F007_9BACL|nr:UV DNA damage repair endonuclease UvsE [Paenibacillus protaetiae]QAY68486.1 UV DNA damage repair endonuclease UvsE [Paenibacillus protaetiae]